MSGYIIQNSVGAKAGAGGRGQGGCSPAPGAGFEVRCRDPAAASAALIAARQPDDHADDAPRGEPGPPHPVLRQRAWAPADRMFRIGQPGDVHDPMVTGTRARVDLGFRFAACRTGPAAPAVA